MAWRTCSAMPRDPAMETLLTGPAEELGLNARLCKVTGNLSSPTHCRESKLKYHLLATSETCWQAMTNLQVSIKLLQL